MARLAVEVLFFISLLLEDGFVFSSAAAQSSRSKTSIEHCVPNPGSDSIGDRALCTFTRVMDVDPDRFPTRIPTVRCKCPGMLCLRVGDSRCLEVKESLQVVRRGSDGTLRNESMEFTVSCVCAVGRSQESDRGFFFRTINYNRSEETQLIMVR